MYCVNLESNVLQIQYLFFFYMLYCSVPWGPWGTILTLRYQHRSIKIFGVLNFGHFGTIWWLSTLFFNCFASFIPLVEYFQMWIIAHCATRRPAIFLWLQCPDLSLENGGRYHYFPHEMMVKSWTRPREFHDRGDLNAPVLKFEVLASFGAKDAPLQNKARALTLTRDF